MQSIEQSTKRELCLHLSALRSQTYLHLSRYLSDAAVSEVGENQNEQRIKGGLYLMLKSISEGRL